MTEQKAKRLACELSALSVFRGILKYDTMSAFIGLLSTDGDRQEKLRLFGGFVYSLAEDNYCFSDFLCRAVFSDENRYIISAAQKTEIPQSLENNAKRELEIFSKLTELDANDLCGGLDFDGYIPQFDNKKTDFVKIYEERLNNVGKYGYGIFATAKMFRVSGEEIVPVKSADNTSLTEFVGYEEERKRVFENTRALCEGRPAANVLLCGDAGTGKSSTVKACANYFADYGVRLIELRKDQLFSLSYIMGRIAENPLKFIIFIDDLSFNKNDDCFSMLKAALEGSASAKADNAVIYATSNRRHIVKESFSDREGSDDIHHSDTVQELMSLSDRFGLTVYFEKPNKALYLEIIHSLARKNEIKIDLKELDIKAEAFALSRGSRSPRAAEQFINSLL
jgi:predicted AAA+ superfamily ATPase